MSITRIANIITAFLVAAFVLWILTLIVLGKAFAHMADRPDLDGWFMKLKSPGGGLCCDFAEAKKIADPDWDTKDGHYRVFLDGRWMNVPDESVVSDPNRYGPALVWPNEYTSSTGKKETYGIRCFMPGAGT